MEVSRRSFLGGALALVAATQLPGKAFASAPTLYGDGIHDDTAALNALLAGKPFRLAGNGVYAVNREGYIFLSGGMFRISNTIHVMRPNTTITDCCFEGDMMPANADALRVHRGADGCVLSDCHIENAGRYGINVEGRGYAGGLATSVAPT